MSQPVQPIRTFRDPAMSLWQSALHKAITRRAAQAAAAGAMAPGLGASMADPHMMATVAAAEFVRGPRPAAAATTGGTLETCASLYAQLAVAKFEGNQAEVTNLENEIKFSVCDPLWAEALIDYEEFLHEKGTIPYVNYPPGQLATFAVLDTLPNKPTVTVALLADWGTGMEDAQALLDQIKDKNPDVVIHLGDIYYAGTPDEVQSNFYGIYQQVLGTNPPPLYTLSGNHDMYSGGAGYYGLLPMLGQPASYFCLRNDNWQFLAMDTGLNDRDPFTVLTNLTFLNPPEVPWQQDKILNAGGRKTVLLSHHQLFSAFGSVGTDTQGNALACNPNLQAAFTANGENLLEQVAWWFWGHEHNLDIYQPYVGLANGCCIGAGAVPMLVEDDPYTPATGLTLPPGETLPPQIIAGTQLGTNGTVYNHAYAIMTLTGADAQVTFYQDEISVENGNLELQESVVYTVG
ncbi:MAG TPA: metallophosphoesterase [Thermoanaerobaculia bacterium]|nr:metallophosphoesterase [Thermoanaerobaculia bacterium]